MSSRPIAPRDVRRAGFTMIELLVALVLAAMIAGCAWMLAQVGTSVHDAEMRRADAERTRRNVETTLGRALERSASSGVSSPNLGMVRVSVATGAGGTPLDTLVLLEGTRTAIPVASRPCQAASPAPCLVLRGDRNRALAPGSLLAVGAATTGYRLLLVAAVHTAYTAPCGSDCVPAAFCSVTMAPPYAVSEVVAATMSTGAPTGGSCAESYYPDGSRCVETRIVRSTAPRPRSSCTAAGTSAWFTELETMDLTAELGFPLPREWAGLSGGGTPAVAAVPVIATRVFTAPEGAERALLVQRGITAAGAWNSPLRFAGPVAAFQVEATHEGSAGWVRGDGVDRAGLASAPNRTTASVPAPGEVGYTYARGYQTMIGVRLTTTVVGRTSQGARTTEVVHIVQSLAPAARGGSREAQ